jgi:hypothetical protein
MDARGPESARNVESEARTRDAWLALGSRPENDPLATPRGISALSSCNPPRACRGSVGAPAVAPT